MAPTLWAAGPLMPRLAELWGWGRGMGGGEGASHHNDDFLEVYDPSAPGNLLC